MKLYRGRCPIHNSNLIDCSKNRGEVSKSTVSVTTLHCIAIKKGDCAVRVIPLMALLRKTAHRENVLKGRTGALWILSIVGLALLLLVLSSAELKAVGWHKAPQKIEDNAIRVNIPCSFYNKSRSLSDPIFKCPECTSQSDQDDILREIFNTIGTTNKNCVEFGFGYGGPLVKTLTWEHFGGGQIIGTGVNTHALIEDGWKPLFFDAEFENPNINLVKSVLTRDTIGATFRKANVPLDVDYVSIDVDSVDVWLLQGLLESGYRPRVFSIEYNSNIPIESLLACEEKWAPWVHSSRIYGSGASSINFVAESFDYQVVEIMPYLDMFYVRKDLLLSKCTAESLESYEFLAQHRVGQPLHNTCDPADAKRRFVDFPLALKGRKEEARKKAAEDIRAINKKWLVDFNMPFCSPLSGS